MHYQRTHTTFCKITEDGTNRVRLNAHYGTLLDWREERLLLGIVDGVVKNIIGMLLTPANELQHIDPLQMCDK